MMDKDDSHLLWIDGLKGLSAIGIAFFWHYQHFIKPPDVPFYNLFKISYNFGFFLVELFFVLSGFGMSIGYAEKIIKREIRFPDYIKKRIIKLYPLFLLTTIFVVLLETAIHHKTGQYFVYPNFDLYHFVLNLLLLQNGLLETGWSFNSPSWVISILVLMYILLYVVCYYSKKLINVYYFFLGAAFCGLIIILSGSKEPLINELIGRGLSCFSIGVLMHGVYQNRNSFNTKRLAYLFLPFLILSYYLVRTEQNQYVGNLRMLIIIGLAPMLMLCVFSIRWLKVLFSWKPFVRLGKISFAVYLFHFPIQCMFMCINLFFIRLQFSSGWIWLCYFFTTITVSMLYTYVFSNSFEPWLLGLLKQKK